MFVFRLFLVPFLILVGCPISDEPPLKAQLGSLPFMCAKMNLMSECIDKTMPQNQISEYIRRIFEDDAGNLWLATNSDGVIRYNGPEMTYFSVKDGLAGSQVTGIIQAKNGDLWFSTLGGVSRFDGKIFTNYTVADGLSSDWVWSIREDRRGRIWVGTVGGVCRFDGERFEAFELPEIKISSGDPVFSLKLASCITEDSDGHIWFGMDGGGVYIFNPSASVEKGDERFRHLTEADGLCDNSIVCILQDTKGRMWLSSRFGGLSMYQDDQFTTYSEDNHIGNNEVWEVYEDRSGHIWFSSEGFGVYRFNGISFTNFYKPEGLSVGAVQCIFEDRKGGFWVGGGGGLYRFDGRSFSHVPRNDGC